MLSIILSRNVIFSHHVSYTTYHVFLDIQKIYPGSDLKILLIGGTTWPVTQPKELQTVRGLLSEQEGSESGTFFHLLVGSWVKEFLRWCVWYLYTIEYIIAVLAYKPVTMGTRALETPKINLTFDICRTSQWNYTYCICPFLFFVTWSLSMLLRLEHLEYPMDLRGVSEMHVESGKCEDLQDAHRLGGISLWFAFRSSTWLKNQNQVCITNVDMLIAIVIKGPESWQCQPGFLLPKSCWMVGWKVLSPTRCM